MQPIALAAIALVLAFEVTASAAAPQCPVPAKAPDRGPSSETAQDVDNSGVTVIQLNPNVPIDSFQGAGIKTIPYDAAGGDPWGEPDHRLRDRIFRKVGVHAYLGGWDHLQKDMLFLRAQEQPVKRLSDKYPEIPETLLKGLVRLIAEEKKKGAKR